MRKVRSQLFLTMAYPLLMLAITGLCGCGGGGGGSNNAGSNNSVVNNELVSIAIQPADSRLAVGKTLQFTATGTFTDGSTSDLGSSVSWSSSSDSVATIFPNGMATAIAPGQTRISATLGGVSGATTLTLPETTLVSIAITPSNPTIAIDTTRQFTATAAYSDGTFQVLTSGVTWNSSDASVAGIDQGGKAVAVAGGSATITATFGSSSATTAITVTPASLLSIAVTPSSPVIGAGMTQQFSATGTFSDNSTQDLTSQATWSSSDGSIAGIDQGGKATAVAGGSATVTATFGSSSATTAITVTPASLLSIAVTPSSPVIGAGMTQQFSATGTFSDNTTQDLTSQVIWSSSDGSIAGIDQQGKAVAFAEGTTSISALFGSLSGSQNLNVTHAFAAGTWEGTYTIYDSVDPGQLGTYTFRFDLNQSGTTITGTSSLRYDTPGQVQADGRFIEGTVIGRKIDFVFSYISPNSAHEMVNIGTATITDTSMTGDVIENYSIRYNCSYIFSLKKL